MFGFFIINKYWHTQMFKSRKTFMLPINIKQIFTVTIINSNSYAFLNIYLEKTFF